MDVVVHNIHMYMQCRIPGPRELWLGLLERKDGGQIRFTLYALLWLLNMHASILVLLFAILGLWENIFTACFLACH